MPRSVLSYPRAIGLTRGTPTANALALVHQSPPLTSHAPRRWLRSGDELCVAAMLRSPKRFNEFVATYAWSDPHWRPLLSLPCGHPSSLEVRARHANYALKHLVQKGHAMYFITRTQHSVFHPRGIAEQSHVTCSMGERNERLVTTLVHEGPLDAAKPDGPRGVVGYSVAWSYATCFQRRPMLWQRSRRVGALQAQLGAFQWELLPPSAVGRATPEEVLLLAKHTNDVGGGVDALCIVSSVAMANHPYHYVHEFEAPAAMALDAVHQCAFKSAVSCKLCNPDETLHAVAWGSTSISPFPSIEADLHFGVQLGRPTMYRPGIDSPPSSLVGFPKVTGAPLLWFDFGTRQGNAEYRYDRGPSARGQTWWSQDATKPYEGHMWCVRDAHVDALRPTESGVFNPFAPLSVSMASDAVQSHVKSRTTRMERVLKRQKKSNAAAAAAVAAAAAKRAEAEESAVDSGAEQSGSSEDTS